MQKTHCRRSPCATAYELRRLCAAVRYAHNIFIMICCFSFDPIRVDPLESHIYEQMCRSEKKPEMKEVIGKVNKKRQK